MASEDKLKETTLWQEFCRQVAVRPNKTAIKDENRTTTYLELQSAAISRGKLLRESYLGSSSKQFVAILLPPGQEYIVTILALFESSVTTAPLSVDYPVNKLEFMLSDLGKPFLVTTSSIVQSLGLSYHNTILLDSFGREDDKPLRRETNEIQYPHDQTHYASAYYTSGSTGVPKAVLMSHSSLLHFLNGSIEYYKITNKDETLCWLNPAFIFSGYEIWTSLLAGGTVNVVPNHLRYDIPSLRLWIRIKGITVVCMVSSSAEIFIKAGLEEFSSRHRLLLCGGEKLQARPRVGSPFTVYSMYGSTETKTATGARIDPVQPDHYPASHTLAGKGFPGVEVLVLDEETLKPVPPGETGEIVIGGLSISQGYFNRPAESAQKFFQLQNGAKVVRTGDLGYFLPDGDLIVLNRRDNQIKVSGYRFDLADLEAALTQHGGVDKAVAVAQKEAELRIHLFYKLKQGSEVSTFQLGEFLQNQLPHYAFPNSLIQVAEFPLTPNGKLDKNALLQLVDQQPRNIQTATNDVETLLIKIWGSILGSQISRDDNFFALGGTSMLAVKVIAELKLKNPDFLVEPFHMFRIPVLKHFAEFLSSRSSESNECVKDLAAEVEKFNLDFSTVADIPMNTKIYPRNETEAILVTGGTGYLGSALILELLQQTNAEIHCLVRASNFEAAKDRLLRCFEEFNMRVDGEKLHRVSVICGDLSQPLFGLTEAQFLVLAENIDQVFHCGAEVHWLKRYEELRAANVFGTTEIIKFVSTRRLKFLHHISTVGVLGACNDPIVVQEETKETIGKVEAELGYTQSKWVAEKLVWKAIENGIPGIVYRPGIIGSHSTNGIPTANPHDFITLLFKACKIVGAYPELHWEFPYGSLDFTTKAIFKISQNLERSQSKAFHTFQNVLTFEDFYAELSDRALERVHISDWKDLVDDAFSKDPGSEILGMIRIFFQIPFYKGMTFFELSSQANPNLNISNSETISCLNDSSYQIVEKLGQIKEFADAVL